MREGKRIYTRGTPVQRAMAHVVHDETTGCWEWDGAKTPAGYANLNHGNGRYGHVTRILYEAHVGPIPEGMELDHLCRNRGCVNPTHLEAVAHTENVRRGAAATFRRLGTCRRGHSVAEYGYRRLDGKGWNCRECRRELRAGVR